MADHDREPSPAPPVLEIDEPVEPPLTGFDVYRDGQVHVRASSCSTCIFNPHSPLRAAGRRATGQARRDQTAVICHATLPTVGAEHQAICRGFFDAHARDIPLLRLAVALHVVTFDNSPTPAVTRATSTRTPHRAR